MKGSRSRLWPLGGGLLGLQLLGDLGQGPRRQQDEGVASTSFGVPTLESSLNLKLAIVGWAFRGATRLEASAIHSLKVPHLLQMRMLRGT